MKIQKKIIWPPYTKYHKWKKNIQNERNICNCLIRGLAPLMMLNFNTKQEFARKSDILTIINICLKGESDIIKYLCLPLLYLYALMRESIINIHSFVFPLYTNLCFIIVSRKATPS